MRSLIGMIVALLVGLAASAAEANGQNRFERIAAMARKLAAEPFRSPQPVPAFLTAISYDDYRDIRFDTRQSLWDGNFRLEFIHPGLFYNYAVKINTIEADGGRSVSFSPGQFSYGRNKFADKIPPDLGFAGFRLGYPFYRGGEFNHVIVFAGASYFRAVARGQVFGLSARGLALDTGLPSGEEFPFFKEFWIERPARDAQGARLYALLDSPSVAGAYTFGVQPGDTTVVTVRARLFLRKAVRELGIAPLTSMFFYGEERPRPAEDWRPEVHDSDGLLIHSDTGEWIWRPLRNPERLRVSYFELEKVRGFGLMQRDRLFQNYEDLETRHELRPSAWITPLGGWGAGQVKLVEIPSRKETNDNIVAYWVPRKAPTVGEPFEIAYQIHFQSSDPAGAAAGRATATRVGNGDRNEWKRVVVDFEGERLRALPESAPVKAVITLSPEGEVVQQSVFYNAVTRGWRLSFQIRSSKKSLLELRAFLQHGQDTLTETWSYQLDL